MYTPGTQLSVLNSHEFLKLLREHRPWLSPAEAATYLGVSLRTLETWRAKGVGPTYRRQGKFVRYHVEVLDPFLSSDPCFDVSKRETNG